MKRLSACLLSIALAGLASSSGAHDEPAASKTAERLGKVEFTVSCNAAAQQEFNRAMALFHSFWFEPAKRSFARVLEFDPACGMAHWGTSVMSMGNPFGWAGNPNTSKLGAPAAEMAQRTGAGSERERDYIAALGAFFTDWQTVAFRPRALAFERAMEALAAKYPEDDEAQILYALALNVTALSTDKSFANQAKAAKILEPLFARHPDHPGVAHYLIHTYDYADLAGKGIVSAKAYGKIAPSVPHALHMPSHIYSRVGRWGDMVDSNRASYVAARAELKPGSALNVGGYDALHAMDYLVFGHLQLAQDDAARKLMEEAAALRLASIENQAATYALAAIPARFAIERNDWAQAASLKLAPADVAWTHFPQSEAILVFARALGAARSERLDAARADAGRLRTLRDAMLAAKNGYWAAQSEFQIKTIDAWIALAEKRSDEALVLMRAAADAEETSDKSPVTPGNIVPSRELLGEMLLAVGRPREALAEFERSLQRDPQRFRGLAGAGRAAEAAGDGQAARQHYAALLAQGADGDAARPELVHARAFLARRS